MTTMNGSSKDTNSSRCFEMSVSKKEVLGRILFEWHRTCEQQTPGIQHWRLVQSLGVWYLWSYHVVGGLGWLVEEDFSWMESISRMCIAWKATKVKVALKKNWDCPSILSSTVLHTSN